MKKVILPIITLFACTANTMAEETNKMYLWMTDGTVVEYNVADVDSLTFQKYEQQQQEVDPKETMQQLRDDLKEFAPNIPNNSYGEVKSYKYSSKTAGHEKNVKVMLPDNYDSNRNGCKEDDCQCHSRKQGQRHDCSLPTDVYQPYRQPAKRFLIRPTDYEVLRHV